MTKLTLLVRVFPKVYLHIQQNIGVMFTERKVKSAITSLLVNKHVPLNSFWKLQLMDTIVSYSFSLWYY